MIIIVHPPALPVDYNKANVEDLTLCEDSQLTEEQKAKIASWLKDYEDWQSGKGQNDFKIAQRQRQASSSIATILVGLPLYLYHWGIIKRKNRR